ncbi:hypothetical protein, partial [Blastococcus sp. SYSU DS0533]
GELLARDAEAAERRRRIRQRAADVTVRPVGDGMSELRALLPHSDARACRTPWIGTPAPPRRPATVGRSGCCAPGRPPT